MVSLFVMTGLVGITIIYIYIHSVYTLIINYIDTDIMCGLN